MAAPWVYIPVVCLHVPSLFSVLVKLRCELKCLRVKPDRRQTNVTLQFFQGRVGGCLHPHMYTYKTTLWVIRRLGGGDLDLRWICVSISPPIYLSIYLSISLSIYRSIYLSIYLSVYLSLSIYLSELHCIALNCIELH